ncbi:MAG TPA: hypothetical protein VIG85_05070 [Comamonas sp.]
MASTNTPSPMLLLWLRLLVWAVVLAALLAVFALYTQPEFMRTLADQVWACF